MAGTQRCILSGVVSTPEQTHFSRCAPRRMGDGRHAVRSAFAGPTEGRRLDTVHHRPMLLLIFHAYHHAVLFPGFFLAATRAFLAHLLSACVLCRPCRSRHIPYQGGCLAQDAQQYLGVYKAGLLFAARERQPPPAPPLTKACTYATSSSSFLWSNNRGVLCSVGCGKPQIPFPEVHGLYAAAGSWGSSTVSLSKARTRTTSRATFSPSLQQSFKTPSSRLTKLSSASSLSKPLSALCHPSKRQIRAEPACTGLDIASEAYPVTEQQFD